MVLEKDIMVLNNVTKFHKIQIKLFDLESGRYLCDGQTGVILNTRPLS